VSFGSLKGAGIYIKMPSFSSGRGSRPGRAAMTLTHWKGPVLLKELPVFQGHNAMKEQQNVAL
jgi:hypothetical protein